MPSSVGEQAPAQGDSDSTTDSMITDGDINPARDNHALTTNATSTNTNNNNPNQATNNHVAAELAVAHATATNNAAQPPADNNVAAELAVAHATATNNAAQSPAQGLDPTIALQLNDMHNMIHSLVTTITNLSRRMDSITTDNPRTQPSERVTNHINTDSSRSHTTPSSITNHTGHEQEHNQKTYAAATATTVDTSTTTHTTATKPHPPFPPTPTSPTTPHSPPLPRSPPPPPSPIAPQRQHEPAANPTVATPNANNPPPTNQAHRTDQQALPSIPIYINTTLNIQAARHFMTIDPTYYLPGNVLANMNQALDTVLTPHIDNVIFEEYHPDTSSAASPEQRARIIIYPGPVYTGEEQLQQHLEIIAHIQVLINNIIANKPDKKDPTLSLHQQLTNPYWLKNNCCQSLSAFTFTLPVVNTDHKLNHIGVFGVHHEWGGNHNRHGAIYRIVETLRALCRSTEVWDSLIQQEQTTVNDYFKYPTKLTEVVGLRHTTLEKKHNPNPKIKSHTQRGKTKVNSQQPSDNKQPVPSKHTHIGIYTADTPAGDTLRKILTKAVTQYTQTQRGRNIPTPSPLSVPFLPQHGLELLIFANTNYTSRDQLYDEIYWFTHRISRKFDPFVCKVIANMDPGEVNDYRNLRTLATTMGDLICLTPQQKGLVTSTASIHVVLAANMNTQLLDAKALASNMDIKQQVPSPPSGPEVDPDSISALQERERLLHPETVATNPTTHHIYVVTWSIYGDLAILSISWEHVQSITSGVSCSFQCKVNTIDEGLALLSRHFGTYFETERDIYHWNHQVPLDVTCHSWHRLPTQLQFLRRRARTTLPPSTTPPRLPNRETSESIVFRFSVTSWTGRQSFLNAHRANSLGQAFDAAMPAMQLLTDRHANFVRPLGDKRLLSDAENAVVLIAIFDSGALENENFTFNMNSPFFFLSYETDKFEPYEHTIQLMQRHRNPPHPVLPSVGHADYQIPPPAEPKRPTQPTMNPPPPPTPPQQPTQQPADTEEFTIEELSLNDVGEELEPSESQEELFAKAASPAPASPKRKTHDDDTDTLPSSTKRRSTEDTDVTMDNPDDTSRPFHELAKGNLEGWELLFHNNLDKHFSHPDLRAILKFFSDITTPLSHQGRTPDGYFPLVIEVAPITTYTDLNNYLSKFQHSTASNPPRPIEPLLDSIVHIALIRHQGPGSNGLPIGPPPPTHAVIVCSKAETFGYLRTHFRDNNLFNHRARHYHPRSFRHEDLPHYYIPEIKEWEVFNCNRDVMWMKENCPLEFHRQLFEKLYKEFHCQTYAVKPGNHMESIKDWFNSISPETSGKTVPSLI